MANNDWKKRLSVVYSTNPDFQYELDDDNENDVETLPPDKQKLKLSFERAGRAGKTVTLVSGFIGTEDDCRDLAKKIKTYCGVGGSVKDGVIVIQGDLRDKIKDFLLKNNYKVK